MSSHAGSIIVTYNAVAGANYGSDNSNIGEAVYESDADEVTVCTALTQEAIGIIVDAQDLTAGWVKVCVFGLCKARIGATFTYGTTTRFGMNAADGRIDPYAVSGAGTQHSLGFVLGNRINDGADGDLVDFVVCPTAPTGTT